MLSAAFDILSQLDEERSGGSDTLTTDEFGTDGSGNGTSHTPGSCRAVYNETTNTTEYKSRYCNREGTSVC